jgi:hypothetical protein
MTGTVGDLTALGALTLFPVPECSSSYGLARRAKTLFAPEQMLGCKQTGIKIMRADDVA